MKKQLIILPGWDGNRKTWQGFINLAQTEFEVTCIELPCFGDEPCPKNIWGVEDYAEFIKNKIIELKIEKPIMLGHSFGGQVAAYLSANNPGLIDKLILSGAAIIRRENKIKNYIFGTVSKIGKKLFGKSEVFKKILYRLADSPDYANTSGIKREIFKKVIRQDVSAELVKITTPTLVVWGDNDKYVPLSDGKKIAQMITGSKLKIVKDGRHGLHIHSTDKFFEIIKNFAYTN